MNLFDVSFSGRLWKSGYVLMNCQHSELLRLKRRKRESCLPRIGIVYHAFHNLARDSKDTNRKNADGYHRNTKEGVNMAVRQGLEDIINQLENNKLVSPCIDLFDGNLSDADVSRLAESLKTSTSKVMEINLRQCQVGPEGAKALAEVLKNTKHGKTILRIVLGRNCLGDEGVQALAEAIANDNCCLRMIVLDQNNIGDEGARGLAEALKINNNLVSLGLTLNKIGPDGMKALAEAFKSNTSLIYFYIGWNNIQDEGAKALADSLRFNTGLCVLDLWNSGVGNEGENALIDIAKKNVDLLSVTLKESHLLRAADENDVLVEAPKRNRGQNNIMFQIILSQFSHYLSELAKGNHKESEPDEGPPFLEEVLVRQGAMRVFASRRNLPMEIGLFVQTYISLLHGPKSKAEIHSVPELFQRSIKRLSKDIQEGNYTEPWEIPILNYHGTDEFRLAEVPKVSASFCEKAKEVYQAFPNP